MGVFKGDEEGLKEVMKDVFNVFNSIRNFSEKIDKDED